MLLNSHLLMLLMTQLLFQYQDRLTWYCMPNTWYYNTSNSSSRLGMFCHIHRADAVLFPTNLPSLVQHSGRSVPVHARYTASPGLWNIRKPLRLPHISRTRVGRYTSSVFMASAQLSWEVSTPHVPVHQDCI